MCWGSSGFVPADGTGQNGVLVVLEAAGEDEAFSGRPTVGKAGHYLWSALKRVGLERDDFRIHNILSCRPLNNKLAGMPYEASVIASCKPNITRTIKAHVASTQARGMTPVILALGKVAFMNLMNLDYRRDKDFLKAEYRSYPFWSPEHECWILAADHPSFLMRGKNELLPILQFCATRAVEIARDGLILERHDDYLLDPPAEHFAQWVDDFLCSEAPVLSYDIETPMKQGEDEEDVSKEQDDDYTILRSSFCWRPGFPTSVPWRAEYMPSLGKLFSSGRTVLGWNNRAYDDPRVSRQLPWNVLSIDAMEAWHVLNTAMPKGLGFVTPYYVQNTSMWKHLSNTQPAFYNAKDADMALRNWLGIANDLKVNGLENVFNLHTVKAGQVLEFMSGKGVLIDQEARAVAELKVGNRLDEIQALMDKAIPEPARRLKIYKKDPKVTEGLIEVAGDRPSKFCPNCHLIGANALHVKSIGKKRLKAGEAENPCFDQKLQKMMVPSMLWAKPLDFKVSAKSLLDYQKSLRHNAIVDRKREKVTFDEEAILKLVKRYPKDPLYPLILNFRGTQKLLTTYIGQTLADGRVRGGMPMGPDGRIHTRFTFNPSTLRSASQGPNLQNLPRVDPKDPDAFGNMIRNMIVASPGNTFYARDYSGIEAVMVGYFAMSPGYIRLSKQDVHSFYTAYGIHALEPGRISANDLPLLSWDDDKLFKRLKEIKKEFGKDRNALYKHLVHGANFMQGPMGAQAKIHLETGVTHPVSLVSKVMEVYFELFPDIRKWHQSILFQADKDGFVRNPFGYIHRFNKVFSFTKRGGQWLRENGPDSNKVIAFLPQSTAAGIIKEAMIRIYFDHYEEAGQFLRLLIHDELFFDVPLSHRDRLDVIVQAEMEKPISVMPLPASYGMGPYLNILTEAKEGPRWGQMI